MAKLMPTYLAPSYRAGADDDEIVAKLTDWRRERGGVLEKLRDVRDTYNGDIVLPIVELDEEDIPAVPNLLNIGLDGHSQRTASTAPQMVFPADGNTATARDRAKMRKNVVHGWWEGSAWDLRRYRAARHYHGYGAFFLFIRPDARLMAPKFELRNPLNTYHPGEIDEDMHLDECIFTSRQSGRWIIDNYPGVERDLTIMAGKQWMSTAFEIIEYVSGDEWVTLARMPGDYFTDRPWLRTAGAGHTVRLDRIPNRTGVCPLVPAGRFGLDRVISQFQSLTGMYVTQAMLQALEVIATKRDIFPDLYLEGFPNQNPVVLTPADGIRGVMGKVMGGRIVPVTHAPGYQTNTTIDRIERNARTTGRVPSEFGGESGTNIRTGRRGDAVVSSTIDFGIQEAQVLMAAAMRKANQIAIEVDLAYYGPRKKVYYLGATNQRSRVADKYVPDELWTTNQHQVSYSHPGSDTSQLVIAVLQLVGAGLLSKESAMTMIPYIDDPEFERDAYQAEQLESAMLASLTQQAASGGIPPADLARIAELVRADKKELFEAIQQVQKEAQERQATPAPADAPEAQPGLAQPGAGAEQPTIPEQNGSGRNLLSLLTQTRLPQMSISAEQGNASQISGIQPRFGA